MASPVSNPSSSPTPTIRWASTLSWLEGLLWLLVLLAQSRIAGSGGNPIIVLVAAGAGVMSCTAGYLLRKQQRAGALLAGGALALSLVMALRTSTLRGPGDYLLLGAWAIPFFLAIRGWPTLR